MSKPLCFVSKSGKLIREEVLEQYASKSASKQPELDTFTGEYDGAKLKQPPYNPRVLVQLLELNTYHMRCCKTKARDTAGLGWGLTPLSPDANEKEKEEVGKFFNGLTEPLQSILNKCRYDYEAIGYGALELITERKGKEFIPFDLKHIPAHTLRRHIKGNKFLQKRGNKKVWFKMAGYEKDVHYETGLEYELGSLSNEQRANAILWFSDYTPTNDFYGVTDIIPAIGAIHGDLARRDYNISFFDNHGVPAYAVFVTGNYDPGEEDEDGRTELENIIEQHFNDLSGNPHSVLILTIPTRDGQGEVEIKFQPLSVEMKEASFRLYRKDNRDEVLSAHGIPPYRVGIAETGSLGGNTAKESTDIYKRSVIDPRQDEIEDIFNRYILRPFGVENWEFELSEIDTSDEEHDLTMCKGLFEMAAMSPNQVISHFGERFGLEKVEHPAMDAYYLQGIPITLDTPMTAEVEKAVKDLQEKLLTIAIKGES